MTARDLLRFLFGVPDAIRVVAGSRAALPVGIILVVFTAVARSYDQTWIGENPILWLFGPLLFSLVSGTWLFLVVYAGFLRAHWGPDERWGSAWRDWPAFMGIYWMTAPSAWLYAIPVERFLGDVPSAQANLTLLAMVSLWRVLLFTRIIQVVGGVKYAMAGTWVLLAACIETFIVLFFTSFGQAIGRSMGGLRNSPAEDVILNAFGFAMTAAFCMGIAALLLCCVWRPRAATSRLGPRQERPMPRWLLTTLLLFWTFIGFWVQPAVHRNVEVEKRVHEERYRDALDYLAARTPADFAPSRPLPPKSYEHSSFGQVVGMLSQTQPEDPEWVRQHMLRRLDDLADSFGHRRRGAATSEVPMEPGLESFTRSYFLHWLRPEQVKALTDSLVSREWLAPWIQRNRGLLRAIAAHAAEDHGAAWDSVLKSLETLGIRPNDSSAQTVSWPELQSGQASPPVQSAPTP